jgi:hypothetical protein
MRLEEESERRIRESLLYEEQNEYARREAKLKKLLGVAKNRKRK